MQHIPEQSVSRWAYEDNRGRPITIDWDCPHCRKAVSFSMEGWNRLVGDHSWSQSHCPRCRARTVFLVMDQGTGPRSLAGGRLLLYPPGQARSPAPEVLESPQLTDPVKRAYTSAVNVVNGGEWNGGAVLCRRLLEGITKTVLPPEKHNLPLAKQLAELPAHRDLTAPLLELADAIRKGGNLGAHFDLEREPDEHVTSLMLELCEDLLQYLFVLPARIADLHGKIEALGAEQSRDREA
jgi:hypothetical protein